MPQAKLPQARGVSAQFGHAAIDQKTVRDA
jgi:hypothetical protein